MKEILEKELNEENKQKFILMKRIKPKPFDTHFLRANKINFESVVYEFGTFGLFIGNGEEDVLNEYGGYLLRTKSEKLEDGFDFFF
jgi:glutathione synthase